MLRDYQEEISDKAVALLNTYKIAYLSMQVRTGKTITALETAKKYGAKNVVFITKKKAISSIIDDYKKLNYDAHFELYINNFEQLHNFTDHVKLFDLVIIDEAHSLGQFPKPSLRTIQLRSICVNMPIIYLSGTPSPESYSQLFHQFFVSSYTPFKHTNFYAFAKDGFVTPKNKYVFNRTLIDYSNANQELIDKTCGHLFLSFTQEEAGFEQLVEEHIHKVKMSDKTYEIVRRLKKDKVLTGKNGQVIEADTEVKLLNKLHQLYSGTVIYDVYPDGEAEGAILDATKIEFIFDKFKGKKLAIYYKFKAEEHMIRFYAAKNFYKVTNSPEEFNNSDEFIFISQFVSGREGVNLSTADCLICLNIDFSAVTYFQVRARLQTKNRTEPAEVHWIFADGGIENDIYEVVKKKKPYTLSYFKKSSHILP
jgi:hypothetical protein